jgi:hypothetical protein
MNIVRYILLLFVLLSTAVSAIEPEPDWKARYQEVKQEYIIGFKPPAAGETVTVIRRIGGKLTGRLTSLSPEYVTIAGQKFEPRQLTDETCEQLFAGVFATRAAREQVLKERNDYRERREAEQRAEAVTTRSIADPSVPRTVSTSERTAPSAPKPPATHTSTPATAASMPPKVSSEPPQTSRAWLLVVAAIIAVVILLRRLSRPRFSVTGTITEVPDETLSDEERLARWKELPETSLSSDKDPVVQFLIDNKGQDRTIRYYGKYRKVHVVDVIKKEEMPFPYLKAIVEGELRTFSFEHITLPKRK